MTIKLRQRVNFPATVTASGGLAVTKDNGKWNVAPDWSVLTQVTSLSDPDLREIWARDPVTNLYYRITIQAFIDNLPEGPPGAAATVAAGTTTTLAPGSNATFTNVGTSSAAIFNVGIPAGKAAGLHYKWSTNTSSSDPTSGYIKVNNASLASATALYISETDADSNGLSALLATWDDSTNIVKGQVKFTKVTAPANFAIYNISGTLTDNGTWDTFAISAVSTNGSLSADDYLSVEFVRSGDKGADGAGTGDVTSNTSSSVDGEIALFNSTTGKQIKRAALTGVLKANSGVAAVATAGTDYLAPPSGTAILKANSGGALANATAGTDYLAPPSGSAILKANSGGALANATAGTDYVAPGTATQFTAQQGATIATLTDGTSIAWDVSTRQKAQVTLGGNRTMSAVTNAVEGVTYLLWVIQDGTGSRTLSWTTTGAGSFDFGSAGAPTLTTTASRADILCFEAKSIASTLKLRYVGIKQGFS
ncbi:MAG: hypothetical protein EKK40_07015 [Bradyrhizobiaceae bacterium]|nr:MAG: hypothetical protein EKK40_07015 [Bradyrhizobiaceae bacterium]